MRQYQAAAKKQVPGALLFFRLGDSSELVHEDAVAAAGVLEITLASSD
jgi:DNA mismatch repair protein MutS